MTNIFRLSQSATVEGLYCTRTTCCKADCLHVWTTASLLGLVDLVIGTPWRWLFLVFVSTPPPLSLSFPLRPSSLPSYLPRSSPSSPSHSHLSFISPSQAVLHGILFIRKWRPSVLSEALTWQRGFLTMTQCFILLQTCVVAWQRRCIWAYSTRWKRIETFGNKNWFCVLLHMILKALNSHRFLHNVADISIRLNGPPEGQMERFWYGLCSSIANIESAMNEEIGES